MNTLVISVEEKISIVGVVYDSSKQAAFVFSCCKIDHNPLSPITDVI